MTKATQVNPQDSHIPRVKDTQEKELLTKTQPMKNTHRKSINAKFYQTRRYTRF